MSTHNKDEHHATATIQRLMIAEGGVVAPGSSNVAADTETAPLRNNRGAPGAPDKVNVQERLKSLNMLVPGSLLGDNAADEYRRIKRPLLSNAFGKSSSLVERGNLIMVTSSVPDEGKTYTAINLALAIAQERDNTVLLIDCDPAQKGSSRIFGLGDKPGLIDVLEEEYYTISDVLVQTDIPGLVMLPAGKRHGFVTELLASHRMKNLVDEITSRYNDRVVIFDVPPMLSTPQTQVIAELVGQVVFVIETGKTPQSAIHEALEMIPSSKAVGLVLNKAEGMSNRGGYYHGYYGTYGDRDDS